MELEVIPGVFQSELKGRFTSFLICVEISKTQTNCFFNGEGGKRQKHFYTVELQQPLLSSSIKYQEMQINVSVQSSYQYTILILPPTPSLYS